MYLTFAIAGLIQVSLIAACLCISYSLLNVAQQPSAQDKTSVKVCRSLPGVSVAFESNGLVFSSVSRSIPDDVDA
jgi:hypothetical protein